MGGESRGAWAATGRFWRLGHFFLIGLWSVARSRGDGSPVRPEPLPRYDIRARQGTQSVQLPVAAVRAGDEVGQVLLRVSSAPYWYAVLATWSPPASAVDELLGDVARPDVTWHVEVHAPPEDQPAAVIAGTWTTS